MMDILSKTKNGQVYICNKCSKIHIEYGNLNFNFTKQEFDDFADYILTLDGAYWEEKIKRHPFPEKLLSQSAIKALMYCYPRTN